MRQRQWRKPGAFLKLYEDQRKRKVLRGGRTSLFTVSHSFFFSCPHLAAHLGGPVAYHPAKINITR